MGENPTSLSIVLCTHNENTRQMNTYKLLTDRERDILLLLQLGKSNKEIAEDLALSINTVKTHLKNLFKKLKVKNRTEASIAKQ